MTDGSGSTAWAYNSVGQVTRETRTVTGQGTFVSQWGYHPGGLMAWMQYPGGNGGQAGETLTYSYHPQGALKNVWSDLGTPGNTADDYYYLQQGLYDAAGRTTLLWLGGTYLANYPTVQNAYSYFAWNTSNGAGRLKMITAGTTSDTNSLLDLRYYSGTDTSSYDPVGNLQTIYRYDTNNGLLETQSFTYDYLDRLLTASANGGAPYSEGYVYDTYSGNLANKSSMGNYTYNAPRQGACSAGTNSSIPHAVAVAGGNGYTYDCNGNMLSRPGQSLSFDAENRLVGVSGSATASFTYNGDGQRVIATVGGTTTVFIGEYLEWTGSTSTMKTYYNAGGRRIAMSTGIGGTPSWLIGDHLGSTTVVTDSNGGTYSTQLYRAFGEVRPGPGNTLATRYTYTGQADDSYINLMWFRSRWYDPALGRFIQPDSIIPDQKDPQSYDRFSYVRNNPMNRVDPSGHADICPECGDGGDLSSEERLTRVRLSRQADLIADKYSDGLIRLSDIKEPSCLVPSTLDKPAYYDSNPYHPDYMTFSLSGGIPGYSVVGATGAVTIDRYFNIYGGIGPNIGKNFWTPLAASFVQGSLNITDKFYPSEPELESFLTGFSINASAGAGPGVGMTYSPFASGPEKVSLETGAYTPQFGVSFMFSFLVVNRHRR